MSVVLSGLSGLTAIFIILMIQKLNTIITKAIHNHSFPGCVIGVVTRNGKKQILPFGRFTYEENSPEMEEDTIFDVASITKSIPTASLALKAVEQGMIALPEPVIRWLPELENAYKNEIQVKHLLTHTLNFNLQLSRCKDLSPEDILKTIFCAEIKSSPGSRFLYCNATSILLGILVERVYGEKLDTLASRCFFGPLKMDNTLFRPAKNDKEKIVPTEIDDWRGRTIQGEMHDESGWKLNEIMTPGSAGLFSTTGDLLVFLEMLLDGGEYQSKRFFMSETIKQISTNQIPDTDACTGLGWELNQTRYMGTRCSHRTIGKTGFTGCVVMGDLEKGIGLVLLSNYTWPQRKDQKEQINSLRREVADTVFSSL